MRGRLAGLLAVTALALACSGDERPPETPTGSTAAAPEASRSPATEPAPADLHFTGEIGLSPGARRPHSLPLNNPPMVPASEAGFMRDDDLVVGLVVAGRARAYPWFVMRNHHVANDTVEIPSDWLGGHALGATDFWEPFLVRSESPKLDSFIPILITLCEACSGAAAFVPAVDGFVARPLVFAQCRSEGRPGNDFTAVGVFTVCDLQTQSRWHPFSGRAESGPLAGRRMPRVPAQVETWPAWRERHPDTWVALGSDEMRRRIHVRRSSDHMAGSALHVSYRNWARENPGKEDERLDLNELVLGVSHAPSGPHLAYPLEELRDDGGFVQLELAGIPYLFVVTGSYRALVFDRRLDSEVRHFEPVSRDPLQFEDESGTVWNEIGEAVAGPDSGRQLRLAPDSYLAEWNDWVMLHPGSAIVGAD